MVFVIFHQSSRQFYCAKRGRKSSFGHMFGGSAEYSGLTAYKGQPAVHLLSRLNLRDPAVGINLPRVQWLPLLCAIRYGACDLGYRVISDRKVKILFQGEKKAWNGFPYEGYPERLLAKPMSLKEGAYDPDDPQSVLSFWAIFGHSHLTPKQYERVKRFAVKKYKATVLLWPGADEFVQQGMCSPFIQGAPVSGCPNARCARHKKEASLRTFAIFEEEAKHVSRLWGPNCGSLQIIYQICPDCGSIRTTNQCT